MSLAVVTGVRYSDFLFLLLFSSLLACVYSGFLVLCSRWTDRDHSIICRMVTFNHLSNTLLIPFRPSIFFF